MDVMVLIARVLLAGVFGIAGLAKLADRASAQQAIQDFGVFPKWARPFGLLLPLVELAIAGALVPTATAWEGAIGALTLLFLFIGVLGLTLARGRRPVCRCFGQVTAHPIGWPTLVRNVLFAAVAGVVIWHGPAQPSMATLAWFSALTPGEQFALLNGVIVLGVGGAVLWLLVQLLAQQGRLLMRLDALEARSALGGPGPTPGAHPALPGLPMGTPAPAFHLTGLYGETLALEALRAPGKPVLLLFVDLACGPCTALLPDLARWQREYATHVLFAVISQGTPEANRAKFAVHGITPVLLQQAQEVAAAYRATGTPIAVLVRPDGTIGSPLAPGVEAIRALVAQTVGLPSAVPAPLPMLATNGRCPHCGGTHGQNGHQAAVPLPTPSAVAIGMPAPPVHLPDLTGHGLDLQDFRGRDTLLLFWNPGCGFCQQMLPDLKAWEADPPPGAPQLLVVSTGAVEANQALGLRSPVVLDQAFNSGRAFGATGTPSAVLVDAESKIASSVAVGAQAVLAIAQGNQDRGCGASVLGNHLPERKGGTHGEAI
jgi:thiol-disulfide isomerase/thioredoxin